MSNYMIVGGLDIAELVLWVFFLFFLGLIIYLRREDRREGYPLEDELTGRVHTPGGLFTTALPKTFHLPHGQGSVTTPIRGREAANPATRRSFGSAGSPIEPTGNPLVDGVGPAAWAERARTPDLTFEGHVKIVPIAAATGFFIHPRDPDPRGMPVIGAEGTVAGTITDVWVDQSERLIRYLEIELAGGPVPKHVLAPMFCAKLDRRRGTMTIDAITAAQFNDVPQLATPGQITLYEEERIQAYFGGGYLYATPDRQEPLL
jgi:photosynthetic reaction center H subunit